MSRIPLLVTLAALLLCDPRPARANGCNTHTWITFHAIEHLPPGQLKDFLSRPEIQVALKNGSIFPDGGYAVQDAYGEMAHWEPFVTAYIDWMIATQPRPFNQGYSGELAAFLMGMASHGMADQVFDSTFFNAAEIYDAEGWSTELLKDFDSATDVFLVEATGVDYRTIEPWVPSMELEALYKNAFDYTIAWDRLETTQELMHDIILSYAVITAAKPEEVALLAERYPWGYANLMDPTFAGAPPCEGEVVAQYMLALWDRLHEDSGAQNWIISTYPRNGSDGHPTDHALVESQVILVSGHGIRRAELAGKITVVDSAGHDYAVDVDTQWGSSEANLIKIRPQEDWAEDETFTVTLAAGLTTLDGLVYDQPFVMTFTTKTGDPGAPTSDPTPHEGEPDLRAPDAGPPPDAGIVDPGVDDTDDGGCGCRAGSDEGAVWTGFALLGMFVWSRRRRRTA